MQRGIIQKWGNSQALRLPKALLNQLGLHENDDVEISVSGETLSIRKAPKAKTLDDLFAGYTGDFTCCELDDGGPVGKEVFD